MNEKINRFLHSWTLCHPSYSLQNLTCVKQAQRYAQSFKDLQNWLKPEQDKLPSGMYNQVCKIVKSLRT